MYTITITDNDTNSLVGTYKTWDLHLHIDEIDPLTPEQKQFYFVQDYAMLWFRGRLVQESGPIKMEDNG